MGDLGEHAFRFIDFLQSTSQKIWQTLPLGPTHGDLSPYQCLSSNAGNPALIDIRVLEQQGLISEKDIKALPDEDTLLTKRRCIAQAWKQLSKQENDLGHAYKHFCGEQDNWLHDYALYIALKITHEHKSWTDWPASLRDRNKTALKTFYQKNKVSVDAIKFEQFLFFNQWHKLKSYANERGIELFGDLPIFVAHDSAEVWCDRHLFLLDDNGHPTSVAGVPPDYFSATGQRWGNPLYHWDAMQSEGFRWWINRLDVQLKLFDLVRIDHFRGFEAYWDIPADEPTAINGNWVKAPGEQLFQHLKAHFGDNLPLVAEDLGIITPEVDALREQFNLPGMKILQFAFGGDNDNPYLPHNHVNNTVVYTGTHDNDTTIGWFESLTEQEHDYIYNYLYQSEKPVQWLMIAAAMASVANTCIIPFQDVLGLNGEHRMNTPGTVEGNWRWRFEWEWLTEEMGEQLRALTHTYQR